MVARTRLNITFTTTLYGFSSLVTSIPDARNEQYQNYHFLWDAASPLRGLIIKTYVFTARAERDGTRAETRFRLSPKRKSPSKSAGASVQSTAGSRVVRIRLSNAGYTTFGGGVRVLATHSIRQFPFHFPSRASSCATRFRTNSTTSI